MEFNFCACIEGFPKFSDICKAKITFGYSACCLIQKKTAPVRYTYYSMCVHINATTCTVMDCKVN